jgi:hypothetical protein
MRTPPAVKNWFNAVPATPSLRYSEGSDVSALDPSLRSTSDSAWGCEKALAMTEEKTAIEPHAPRRFSKGRVALAWAIAAAVDAVQIAGVGAALPLNEGLDIIVAIALTFLIGWHIAFIPTFIIESLPFADLAPTWTLAVFIATRGKRRKDKPVLPAAK